MKVIPSGSVDAFWRGQTPNPFACLLKWPIRLASLRPRPVEYLQREIAIWFFRQSKKWIQQQKSSGKWGWRTHWLKYTSKRVTQWESAVLRNITAAKPSFECGKGPLISHPEPLALAITHDNINVTRWSNYNIGLRVGKTRTIFLSPPEGKKKLRWKNSRPATKTTTERAHTKFQLSKLKHSGGAEAAVGCFACTESDDEDEVWVEFSQALMHRVFW